VIHDERYQVRHPDTERTLRTLATLIEAELDPGMGFGLFLVKYGAHVAAAPGAVTDEGAVFWISNSDRAGMVDAIEGWIDDSRRRGVVPADRSALVLAEITQHGAP
jgi:hypothetical protein